MINKFLSLLMMAHIVVNAAYIKEENDSETVILDTKTNLIWQDFNVVDQSWKDAITYCEGLEVGIYKDWKLPNYVELYSLVDLTKAEPSMNDIFTQKVATSYWTSTINTPGYVWTIDFKTGGNKDNYSLETELKTRCVHTR